VNKTYYGSTPSPIASISERVNRIRILPVTAILVSAVLASKLRGELSPIPDKLVVLTFDDGNVSDYTFVRPLLKRYGFGATFYVTSSSDWLGIPDRDDWRLSWAQARELEKDGFEIGNHSFTHANIVPLSRAEATQEIAGCERTFQEQGLAKPTTFAYPGASYNLTSMELLKEHDYQFSRRGHFPEYANLASGARGPAYDPQKHHPLLVPSTLMPGPGTRWDDFVWAVNQARDGKICVLTFHGVPDRYPHCSVPPDAFKSYMNYLKDQGCMVIALRDLAKYVDPDAYPKDKEPYESIYSGLVISPTQLSCEYADNPLGIDSHQPRFS